MAQTWQLALLDRMLAHHQAGNTTDMVDEVYRNRIDKYVRGDRYEAEVDTLFRGLPVLACMTPDVPKPGDYMTLSIADVPVLVARGEDGVVRAFRNVCRHCGSCVAEGRGHNDKTFLYPYHAWSYRLDGSLVAMTHKAGFAGVDKNEHGLSPIACGETAGFVERTATAGAAGALRGSRQRASPARLAQTTSTSCRRRCCDWSGRTNPALSAADSATSTAPRPEPEE